MYIDILVFACIAAFLVYRLMSVLGTRHGGERERRNPFADTPAPEDAAVSPVAGIVIDHPAKAAEARVLSFGDLIDSDANTDGRIDTGLMEIAAADAHFELNSFMQGARAAFEMIVVAYAKGDLDTLKPLLSPKLFSDFSRGIEDRIKKGHASELTIHRITRARIIEAHLGGTMAYVTVDFDVEETTVTRDADGKVIDGNPDRIFSVEDIWTFTRDTRASDPNWTLIETRAPDAH